MNRVILVCLAIIVLLWVGAYITDLQQQRDDREFFRTRVAPSLHANPTTYSPQPLSKWLERSTRRANNAMFRVDLILAGGMLTVGWLLLGVVRGEVFWKKHNAADRPADADAGAVVREMRNLGSQLISRAARRGLHFLPFHEREVEVDFTKRTVVFRGFKVIDRIFRNQRAAALTLPFTDILGGRIWVDRGHSTLNLRTTAGRISITDDVLPFDSLACVLLDLAEVNRKDSSAYAAALAREPKIKTPWYGWLIFAAALALVAALGVLLWRVG